MGYDRGDRFHFDFEPNGINLVQNQKENCHHGHIPSNFKGNGILIFSVFGVLEPVLFGCPPFFLNGSILGSIRNNLYFCLRIV